MNKNITCTPTLHTPVSTPHILNFHLWLPVICGEVPFPVVMEGNPGNSQSNKNIKLMYWGCPSHPRNARKQSQASYMQGYAFTQVLSQGPDSFPRP